MVPGYMLGLKMGILIDTDRHYIPFVETARIDDVERQETKGLAIPLQMRNMYFLSSVWVNNEERKVEK
ncbi:hypothetical protein GQ457_01G043600 [Hibiscus cannabinus]